MDFYKKIIVYYRDFPSALESIITADTLLSFVKDGSLMCEEIGKRMPRLTIFVKATKKAEMVDNKKRVELLDQQLKLLKDSNQIISYTIL